MSFLRRIFRPNEKREMTLRDPEGWRDILGPASASGVIVTPRAALGVPAVLRAVTLLSGAVASLPLKVYRKTDDGREVAEENQVHRLLHRSPNPVQTPFTFKELIMNHLLLNGNFFGYIEWSSGKPQAIWPLDPLAVDVERENGTITYVVRTSKGDQVLEPEEVLHIVGITLDGIVGISPITFAREAIGGAIAELRHGYSFFKNGANLSGVLQHPGHLGEEAAENLRRSWREKFSGADNAGKVAILEEGMTFQPISLSNKDSQWLESRQLSVLDVARIFGVPPALLGHLERASYASQEAQDLEFLVHSLRPWLSRIEQAINKSLIGHANLYAEFATGDLVRTTIEKRYQAYRVALAAGFMTVNEVRALENLPAVEGGDVIYRPLNMGVLGEEEEDEQGD